jgi:stearoyl-CoA desaturase (Delta-9 desaturase)
VDEANILSAKHLIPARRFVAEQRGHFIGSVLLPSVLAFSGPWWLPSGWLEWKWAALALIMWWIVGCWGITVGFHRLFSHRSFSSPALVRYVLGALGSMAAQGSVTYWVALHRCHHTHSDQQGDPHSPSVSARPGMNVWHAFWKGHIGWAVSHDVPKSTRYAVELLADPVAKALSRQYTFWVLMGVVLPAVLGFVIVRHWHGAVIGAWWGGIVRLALGHQIIWSINSVCHRFGSRPHTTADTSTNSGWLSLLSWGESWHNNHHAWPTSARLGCGWFQPDVGWWCVSGLRIIGLAKMIRLPDH